MILIFELIEIVIVVAMEVGFGCGRGWLWWFTIFVVGVWCL